MKTKTHTPHRIHGLLIDPYRQSIDMIEVSDELEDWHKILRCSCIDMKTIVRMKNSNTIDLVYDDEFLYRIPGDPRFKLKSKNNSEMEIYGYGLIFGGNDRTGETGCFHILPAKMDEFTDFIGLQFEMLCSPRFQGNEWIEQRMRSIDSELPGKYETLLKLEGDIQ
jgi:hypothetical protein